MSDSFDVLTLKRVESIIQKKEVDKTLKPLVQKDPKALQEVLEESFLEENQVCIDVLLPLCAGRDQSSLLVYAAQKGDLINIQNLSPYCDIEKNSIALFMAARYNHLECVQFLSQYISVSKWGEYEWQYASKKCKDWLEKFGQVQYEKTNLLKKTPQTQSRLNQEKLRL